MRAGPKKCRETLLEELDRLFRQNQELMYQVALRVTRNHHDAEDVLQKIFTRLMQRVLQGAPPPTDFVKNPQGYLYRVAINEATSTLRWRKGQKTLNINTDSVETGSVYTPNWVAKSSIFFAAKSTGTRGADSPVPGPFSPGLAMCAVRKPFDAAERRSSLCAAHIITSSARRFSAAAVMR